MKFRLGLILLLLLVGCSKNESPPASYKAESPTAKIDPATTATISGVVSFEGDPPKPPVIDMSQDPACVMGKASPNFGEAYVVNKGHLQNVYVYIKDVPATTSSLRRLQQDLTKKVVATCHT